MSRPPTQPRVHRQDFGFRVILNDIAITTPPPLSNYEHKLGGGGLVWEGETWASYCPASNYTRLCLHVFNISRLRHGRRHAFAHLSGESSWTLIGQRFQRSGVILVALNYLGSFWWP